VKFNKETSEIKEVTEEPTETTSKEELAKPRTEKKHGPHVTSPMPYKMASILLFISLVAVGYMFYTTYDSIEMELASTKIQYDSIFSKLKSTEMELASTKIQYDSISSKLKSTETELASTKDDLSSTLAEYDTLTLKYGELSEEFQEFKTDAIIPPYTIISGRNVTWAWKTSYGKSVRWLMPIDTYRSYISKPKPANYRNLKVSETGEVYRAMDFAPFVDKWEFSEVIPDFYYSIYNNTENDDRDRQFIFEIWYLVSKLTTYSSEITETPRWGIETLTEAGGDCEDTAILVASLLKAAPSNYKVQLVYMDAHNPTNPKTVNHVIVRVEAGEYKTYIETTSKTKMNPYSTVTGWHIDV
jgi:archaellum component FlaF (FlaF/FlaG flagellin family)